MIQSLLEISVAKEKTATDQIKKSERAVFLGQMRMRRGWEAEDAVEQTLQAGWEMLCGDYCQLR